MLQTSSSVPHPREYLKLNCLVVKVVLPSRQEFSHPTLTQNLISELSQVIGKRFSLLKLGENLRFGQMLRDRS